MLKLIKIIIIAFILIVIGAGVFLYSARDVEIVSAEIDGISGISLSGLTMEGGLEVYNGGFLPVRLDRVDYNITIEGIDGVIGDGELIGGVIAADETKEFPFEIRLSWVPSVETALQMLEADYTYANVEGVAHIIEMKGLMKIDLPFSAKVNLEGYIEQFIPSIPEVVPEGIVEDVVDVIGDVYDYVADNAGDLIDVVQNMTG